MNAPSPHFFGVRHLSPGAAFHLDKLLDEVRPEAVLVEGPSDASLWMEHMVVKGAKPPLAILAYTEEAPVRSLILPFAEYSPEYRAILWAQRHSVFSAFIDLPSGVFLARQDDTSTDRTDGGERVDLYSQWAAAAGYEDYESYWESAFEHNLNPEAYRLSAFAFGESLRALRPREEDEENLLREAYMRRCIHDTIASGIAPEKIVVVTGAYHTPVLWGTDDPVMSDPEIAALLTIRTSLTLMPYSYLRLSSRSGYGAGNHSPRYFHLMWQAFCNGTLNQLPALFFTELAAHMRESGTFRSPAEVIEAVRLSSALAVLRNESHPTLEALRQAAQTCLGQGELSAIAEPLARIEIGTSIGELPEGVSRTAIQDDFYRELNRLKLDKYKSTVAQDLVLDLRENRSAFLHRLHTLGISFVEKRSIAQDSATWKEPWVLHWTPEAEIELVESSLRGETVEIAAAHALSGRLGAAKTVADVAAVIEQSALCALPAIMDLARQTLQAFSINSDSFAEISYAAACLSATIHFGDLRRLKTETLNPLLEQLFLRGSLTLAESAKCNAETGRALYPSIHALNKVALEHYDLVDEDYWLSTLHDIAERDDLNPGVSGYVCAILLERNRLDSTDLERQLSRRLSPGIDADIGAGWFEGLAGRNHYGLLSRLIIWQLLDDYVATLDEEQFVRALVFLRRAFSDFSPAEKRSICDMLGETWNLSGELVEDTIAREYTEEEKIALAALNDFNFDDF